MLGGTGKEAVCSLALVLSWVYSVLHGKVRVTICMLLSVYDRIFIICLIKS